MVIESNNVLELGFVANIKLGNVMQKHLCLAFRHVREKLGANQHLAFNFDKVWVSHQMKVRDSCFGILLEIVQKR